MRIKPIVEGHGEVTAIPTLLRRLAWEASLYGIDILSAIRAHRTDFSNKEKVERLVQLARLDSPDGIIIVFDADDDCPVSAANQTSAWATAFAHPISVEVVVANREYEAWFLAAIESLRGQRGIIDDAIYELDPEAPRNAKGEISSRMISTRSYSETADQNAFTSCFDMRTAFARSRSFRKLVSSTGKLFIAGGHSISVWPPADW